MKQLEFDVAVIGGGPAGTVAAIASARRGAKTILVEQNGYLGGALTACGTGPQMTYHAGDVQVVRGIPQEMEEEMIRRGFSTGHIPDAVGFCSSTTAFDPEGMKIVWEDMAREAGVTLMYHTVFTGCTVENGVIRTARLYTKGGFYELSAKVFVDASADAELILLAYRLLSGLGVKNLSVNINSIGCPNCRPKYHATLKSFLSGRIGEMCSTCQTRFDRNPLRVLDCKEKHCQELVADAPSMLDLLCDDCKAHFAQLQSYLDAAHIPYQIDPRIVRGLDYYTKTVFELITKTENGNLTVCGGGRYDNLVEELGGPSLHAVGFGMGIDISNIIGVAAAIVAFVAFMVLGRRTVDGAPENV